MRELERWHTFLRARFKLASCFHPFQRLFIFLFVQRTVLFDVTVVVISFFLPLFYVFPTFLFLFVSLRSAGFRRSFPRSLMAIKFRVSRCSDTYARSLDFLGTRSCFLCFQSVPSSFLSSTIPLFRGRTSWDLINDT